MGEQSDTELRREDFQNALKDIDSFIDITLDDLMQINQMAHKHAQMRSAEQLLVRDIMTTDVTTITPETSLRDAARILLELRISGLPVVDANNKLVGIVTEADFLSAMGIPCHHPAHSVWQTLESMFSQPPRTAAVPVNVGDLMAKQIVSISADKTLHDVIKTMKQHHIKRLIVTDSEQHVQGIITRSNLVQVLLRQIL